jgi:hypothetical protein
MLAVLVMTFLSVAGAATAGGPYPYYPDDPYYYDAPCHTVPRVVYVPKVVYVPYDIRLKIAELERLKSEIHYHALSCYPADIARASWLADRVARLNYEIETWRLGCRY